MPATVAKRQSQLAQIHIGRKALGMSEDEYRDLLSVKFAGLRSAAALNDQQRAELLRHFQLLGWNNQAKLGQAKAKAKPAWRPEHRKLFSVWQQLADAKLVTDRSPKALASWCAKLTAGASGPQSGVANIAWLHTAQATALIECAKQWLSRGSQPTPADALLAGLQARQAGPQPVQQEATE